MHMKTSSNKKLLLARGKVLCVATVLILCVLFAFSYIDFNEGLMGIRKQAAAECAPVNCKGNCKEVPGPDGCSSCLCSQKMCTQPTKCPPECKIDYQVPDDECPACNCPDSIQIRITTNKKSPKRNLQPLTIHCNQGRLGNQMCSFAVLYGVSVLNNRTMSVLPCNMKLLSSYFAIKVPVVNINSFVEHYPWNIGTYLHPEDNKISDDTNIIKGYYHPCSYTFFNHIRQEIKSTFRFKEDIQSFAQHLLLQIKGGNTNVTFVGVHVRRGDYVKWTKGGWLWAFDGREVDHDYFTKAAKYFRDKYSNVLFVVLSDDLPWCKENLKEFGMYIPDRSAGPAHDLAILANCNHTVMTYGTFGFWGAYLSGGDTVYFDNFLKPGTSFIRNKFQYEKMYLPEWVGIDTAKEGYWENFTRPP